MYRIRVLDSCAFVAALLLVSRALSRELPGLSVPDLIALTRIGSLQYGGFGGDDRVVSPDRTRVAVVVQKGDLLHNSREFSLLVFDTRRPFESHKAETVARFVTTSNRPGIAQVVWLSEETLSFIGESPEILPQIYRLNLHSRRLAQLTHSAQGVTVFKAGSGGAMIYATEAPPPDTSRYVAMRAHGFAIPPEVPLSDVIAGKWERISAERPARARLHVVRNGLETSVELPDPAQYGSCLADAYFISSELSLAPSGDVALMLCRPKRIPTEFTQYSEEKLRQSLATGSQYQWWIVLDLRTGATHPLTGGPVTNFDSTPIWTSDGRAVVVVNDFLPLAGVAPDERNTRASRRLTGEVDVQTGAAKIVPEPTEVVGNSLSANFPIEIREGPSEPWKLISIDPHRSTQQVLFDPNPELTVRHRLAQVTLVTWKVPSGAQLTAGLYWPLDYSPGKRYPLVIQTHGFAPDKFSPDGYSTTGYAAQPLAAAGLMVVQAYRCTQDCLTPQRRALSEGEKVQQDWEGLIDQLARQGLIDRTRIALQGYSRACFHELYFMTHSHYPIAAMTCADGVDESYLQYLFSVPSTPASANDSESHNGGPPVGPALKTWMERAPGFNLDRIHAPIQLTALGGGASLLGEWEPFAGLIAQGKPAELKFLPGAAHNIVRPWERFAAQQNTVDWFRFWLQSYERAIPIFAAGETAKGLSEQYARWHKLRCLQQRNEEARKRGDPSQGVSAARDCEA